jgi:hypothetical protein
VLRQLTDGSNQNWICGFDEEKIVGPEKQVISSFSDKYETMDKDDQPKGKVRQYYLAPLNSPGGMDYKVFTVISNSLS